MTVINEYALKMLAAELRARIAGRKFAIATIRARNQIQDPPPEEMSIAVNQAHLDELDDMFALTTRLGLLPESSTTKRRK